MGLLLLLLAFICSLARLLPGLFLSLFEESLAGEEGTTQPEAFRAGTHARGAGEDETPQAHEGQRTPLLPALRARQRRDGRTDGPPAATPRGAAAKGLKRLREPCGPGRAEPGSPGCWTRSPGHPPPLCEARGARTGAGVGGRGRKAGFSERCTQCCWFKCMVAFSPVSFE